MSYEDFYDIIAIRFGGTILLGHNAIEEIKRRGDYDQLLSRAEFKMLSRMDLGDKWEMYADDAPTLFTLPKDTAFNIRMIRPYCHKIT
jgi:hypothetical protein